MKKNNCKIFFLIVILYLLLTLGEVIIHKYVMHNKDGGFIRKIYGDSHIVHHLDVLDDMKLKENYFKKGLFFAKKHVIAVLLLVFIFYYPILLLFGYKIKKRYVLILGLIIGLFYKYTWDFLHYSFHQINQIENNKKNKLFYWLFKNHSYHHLVKGKNKGNFNIIFPGGDHLLNSYNNCIDNREYCKNPHSSHIEMCNMEKNRIKLDHGFKWCD